MVISSPSSYPPPSLLPPHQAADGSLAELSHFISIYTHSSEQKQAPGSRPPPRESDGDKPGRMNIRPHNEVTLKLTDYVNKEFIRRGTPLLSTSGACLADHKTEHSP